MRREDRERIKLQVCNDGEFWIPLEEFLQYFDDVDICYTEPISDDVTFPIRYWYLLEFIHFQAVNSDFDQNIAYGEWNQYTAGGRQKYTGGYKKIKQIYIKNLQIHFTVIRNTLFKLKIKSMEWKMHLYLLSYCKCIEEEIIWTI